MGKNFGAAKEGRLVPVVMAKSNAGQMGEAFQAILDEITNDKQRENPVRYKNSIIMMSLGIRIMSPDVEPWVSMKSSISSLFDLGVPVVFASGNDAGMLPGQSNPRTNVDHHPQYWASDDFPIINVGSIDKHGRIPKWCQRGPKVTTYTMEQHGLNGVVCVSSENERGTSFVPPLIAGGLAVFMSQKEGPFYEKTKNILGTRDFVFAVRDFLKHEAGYKNFHGVRQFWNMAPAAV